MNENIDLRKILKDCPKGTILYSLIHGYVEFFQILDKGSRVIEVISITRSGKRYVEHYTFRGQLDSVYDNDECVLFPSKEQRDWSKFTAPWYAKERFDPKTLKPFDKVLVRYSKTEDWNAAYFSHILYDSSKYDLIGCEKLPNFMFYTTGAAVFDYCIPYNDETKHIVGTTKEPSEYYRYWEN